jgi:hypothetical protein
MLDILNTGVEWFMYGFKGILGLLSVTSIIAIVGSAIAFVYAIIANIVFWPIYLSKRSKKQTQ